MPAQQIAQNLAYINWTVLVGLGLGTFAAVLLARTRTAAPKGFLAFTAICAAAFGALAWLSDGALTDAAVGHVAPDPVVDQIRRAGLAVLTLAALAWAVSVRRSVATARDGVAPAFDSRGTAPTAATTAPQGIVAAPDPPNTAARTLGSPAVTPAISGASGIATTAISGSAAASAGLLASSTAALPRAAADPRASAVATLPRAVAAATDPRGVAAAADPRAATVAANPRAMTVTGARPTATTTVVASPAPDARGTRAATTAPTRSEQFIGLVGLAAGVITLVAAAYGWGDSPLNATALLIQLAVLCAATGGVFASMILGHWYLVTPKLGEEPLVLLSRALLVVVGIQLVLFIASLALGAGIGTTPFGALTGSWALFVWLRLIVGLVFPLIVSWAAVQTAKTRSMESATGLLYINVGAIAAGTILASGLYFGAGLLT